MSVDVDLAEEEVEEEGMGMCTITVNTTMLT